jgi:hypothetical protein
MIGAQQNINAAVEITPSTAVGGTTFSTPVIVFTQAGNVGIGVASPANKLQIGSAGTSGYGGNDIVIGNGTQVMAFYQSTTVSTWYTNTSFSLMPSGTGSVGNLGVGIASPATRLDVGGIISARGADSSTDNIRFYNTDGNYSYIRTTAASNTNNTWFDAPLGATIWLGWDNPGQARTASTYSQVYVGTGRGTINESVLIKRGDIEGKDGSGTTNFRILATGALGSHTYFNYGNVGVGTSTPSSKLHVKGNAVASVGLVLLENDYSSGSVYYPSLSVVNTRGNHSYGIVAEFRTSTSGDSDRPSILFYGAQAAHSWQVGQVTSGWGTNDAFGIGYRASNTPGSFSAWPTNYFTILTGGNVGINQNSPTLGKLQITGDNNQLAVHTTGTYSSIYFYNGASDRAGIYVSNTETHFEGRGSSGLYFGGATSQNHIRITSGGDVGIGTTGPEQRLHVAGGISQFVYSVNGIPCTVRIHNDNNDQEAGIRIRSKSSGGNNMHADIAVKGTGSDDVGYLGFKVPFNNTSGSGYKMAILSTGNVGIGTTSPSYTLDVAGQISMHDEAQDLDSRYYGGTFLRGWQSFSSGSESSISYTTDTTCPIGIEVISVSTFVWARGPKIRLDKTQNYEVEIWIKRHTANTAGTFYFVVSNYDSSGNVISGDGTDWHYPTNVTPPSTSWTKYSYIVGPYGGSKDHSSSARYISVGFIANYTGGNDVIYLSGFKCRPIPRYNNDALTIYNSGSIGIKKNNPSYALDVTGDIRATSDIIAYSDISVKENIRLIENPLDRINKIRGVKFDRIDTGEKDNLGFIAQEIEEEFPELVSTDDDGKKAVKYQNTVAVLVEAIKEQQIQIQEQKVQNGLLLNRIESLESQLQNRGI